MRRKNYNKKVLITLSIVVLFVNLFLTVGYSSFSKELTIDKSLALIRADKKVRINSFSLASTSNGGTVSDTDYNVSSVVSNLTLPNSNSTVTYSITVKNYGNVEMGIKSISLPEELDEILDISLEGYVLGTKLRDNNDSCESSSNGCKLSIERTFNIIIKYKNNAYNSSNYNFNNFKLDFVFEEAFDIVYNGFVNLPSNMPDSILKGATFSYNVGTYNEIEVLRNGVASSDYSVSNNVVTISNVITDIQINNYYFVNISISPDNATIEYTINDGNKNTTTGNLNIKVLGNSKLKVDASISYKYDTYSETITSVTENIDRDVTLNRILYTYTVESNLSSNFLLEYDNTSIPCNNATYCSVDVDPGTAVNYTVSKDYYVTQSSSDTINSDYTKTITLSSKPSKEIKVYGTSVSCTKSFDNLDSAASSDGVDSTSRAGGMSQSSGTTLTWSYPNITSVPEGSRIDSFNAAFKIDATISPSYTAILTAGGKECGRLTGTYDGVNGKTYSFNCSPTSAQLRSGTSLAVTMKKTGAMCYWYGSTLTIKYTEK